MPAGVHPAGVLEVRDHGVRRAVDSSRFELGVLRARRSSRPSSVIRAKIEELDLGATR